MMFAIEFGIHVTSQRSAGIFLEKKLRKIAKTNAFIRFSSKFLHVCPKFSYIYINACSEIRESEGIWRNLINAER